MRASILLSLLWVGCTPARFGPIEPGLAGRPAPEPQGYFVQALMGATDFTDIALEASGSSIAIEDGGTSNMPLLGAVVMLPLHGDRLQFGVEAGATVGFDSARGLVRFNNGTLTGSDNEVFLADFFVGAYADAFLGERWRLYGGAGPVLQFGHVEVDYLDQNNQPVALHEDGFGIGVYARTGIELFLWDATWAGIGVRWLDSRVDPGGDFSDLDFKALQYTFTVTYRY